MNPKQVANQARQEVIDELMKILQSSKFNVTLKVVNHIGPIKIVIPVTKEQLDRGIDVANQLESKKDGK